MATFIRDKAEVRNYIGADVDTGHIDTYILGGLLVKVNASGTNHDTALEKAGIIAYQDARRKVESEASGSYPFLEIQDPMPAATPAPIRPDRANATGTQVEVTTLDAMLDAMGYRRSVLGDRQRFHMPAIVNDQAQAHVGTVESILTGKQVSPYTGRGYSKSVKGKGIAPTMDKAVEKAQNDAYRQLRSFLADKNDAYVLVVDPAILAGIVEIVDKEAGNRVALEKVFNVYGYKRTSKIFDAPEEPEDDEE